MTPRPLLVVLAGLPGSGKTTLATRLASSLPAARMCPDDWMAASGIDLWDQDVRARVEAFQLELTVALLAAGTNVVVEWGTWAKAERDTLRDAARAVGARVELRHLYVEPDELWRRVASRDLEARAGSRPIRRDELDAWLQVFEAPTDDELATWDRPGA